MTDWDISDYDGEGDSVDFDMDASDTDSWSEEECQQQLFDPTEITESIPLLPFDNQVGGNIRFDIFFLKQSASRLLLTTNCRPRVYFSLF
jgi:hypothetical protein